MGTIRSTLSGRSTLFGAPGALASASMLALGAIWVGGCPDPAGRFDDFVNRSADLRDVVSEDDVTGGLADVSGWFHFVITPAPVSQDLYLQFLSEQTFTFNEDGTGTLDMVLRPLTLTQGTTDGPREVMTGEDIDILDVPVAADGTFSVNLGVRTVPGAANPISGAPIIATLILDGTVVSEDFVCGAVRGEVTQPIQAALTGQFGSTRVDPSAATDPSQFAVGEAIANNCAAGGVTEPEPEPDTSETDIGEEPDAGETDTGEVPSVACTDEDLAGEYDLQFKTAAQTDASDVRMILTASGDDNCYAGIIQSKTDEEVKLATVTKARLEEGTLVLFLEDFQIPPGQTALLPNGGVADVTMEASLFTDAGSCGEITFALKEPFSLESQGGFAAAKLGSGASVQGPSCDELTLPGSDDCPAVALAGTWDLYFKTAAQAAASSVFVELQAHPTACYQGEVLSKTSGEAIASVESFLPGEDGAPVMIFRDFIIPPGQTPLLPNGGVADVALTPTLLEGERLCGDILYTLKEPFSTTSEGTFAAALEGGAFTVDGHTCEDIQ